MKNLSACLIALGFSQAIAQPTAVDICLVTVSETFDHNIVVWDKPSDPSIVAIKVYREDMSGNFIHIGTEPVTNYSEYHDLTANPNLRPYSYKISSIDAGGGESVLSDAHATIHVSAIDFGGIPKVMWTDYVGYSVDSYQCWRDSMSLLGNTDWQLVFTAGSSQTQWNDNNPPFYAWFNYTSYMIDILWTHSCEATRAVNHNTSRSNKTQGIQPAGLNESIISEISVFPNPASNQFNLVFSSSAWEPISWNMIDASGRIVLERNNIKVQGQYRESLDISNMSQGLYFIRINSPFEIKVIPFSIIE